MRINGLEKPVQQKINFRGAKNQAQISSQTYATTIPHYSGLNSVAASNIARMNLNNIKAQPMRMISFSGNKIAGQTAFIGAEMPPYFKVGGVATVMNDYGKVFDNQPMILPYYNGEIKYNNVGAPTGEVVVLKKGDTPIVTNADLSVKSVEDLKVSGKDYHELETVATKKMEWGGQMEDVTLYKVKDKPHFFVYTESTAKMPKPYADEIAYSSSAKAKASHLGDVYAKYNKAFVELLPEAEKVGLNPEHILCSDAQTAFIQEYMAQRAAKGDEYYKGLKSSYIMHNIGSGYQGETSAKNMFYDFASNKQVKLIENDPDYFKALKEGTTENYFKQFVKTAVDKKGSVNPTMIPIRYAQQGAMNLDTVSETYAEDAIKNPKVANGLTEYLKELSDKGRFGGILNGFSDSSFDPNKIIGMTYYKDNFKDTINGKEVIFKPFGLFKATDKIEDIISTKQQNAKNLFQRLQEGVDQKYSVGLDNRGKGRFGNIDPKWIEKIDNGEKVNLFTSWGRGDFQKGLDNVLNAFEMHAKTADGKNSVLVLGGELIEGSDDAQKIEEIMARFLKDPELKGRVVFMNGFAPNKVLASAADACVFASRFEPCGLTDFEAMLHGGATPIVSKTQGFKQKNFDARHTSLDKATGYTTTHEYYISDEELKKVVPEFKEDVQKLVDKEKAVLKHRGVSDVINDTIDGKTINTTIDRLALENVTKTKEYDKLFRKYSDELQVKELAEALGAKVTESIDVREKTIRNCLNVKTDWANNAALHPSGKSSKQMYEERHIGSQLVEAKERVFKFTDDIKQAIIDRTNKVTKQVSEITTNSVSDAEKTTKNILSFGKKAKYAGIAAGALAAVGGIIYLLKPKAPKDYVPSPSQVITPPKAQPVVNNYSNNNAFSAFAK